MRVQPIGTFGDTLQNSVWGPGAATVDLSFFKDFDLRAERRLQIRVETFNLFNRANLDLPYNSEDGELAFQSTTGRIFATVGDSREIQFGVKFIF